MRPTPKNLTRRRRRSVLTALKQVMILMILYSFITQNCLFLLPISIEHPPLSTIASIWRITWNLNADSIELADCYSVKALNT